MTIESCGPSDAVPEPGQNDGGGFAEAGRDVDKQRATFAASGQRFGFIGARVAPARQTELVAEGLFKARRSTEEFVVPETHSSPPSLSAGAKCLFMDCLRFWLRAKANPLCILLGEALSFLASLFLDCEGEDSNSALLRVRLR